MPLLLFFNTIRKNMVSLHFSLNMWVARLSEATAMFDNYF